MFFNLLPEDLPSLIFPAELICQEGKWLEVKGNSVWTASGLYSFVRFNGHIYVCKANRRISGVGHIDLANGRPVDYAGEIQFAGRKKRGALRYWNNASGHYQPSMDQAECAGLPLELFRPGVFR